MGKLGTILGVQLLNFVLLAAHDPTVKTACHRDKVRGLGASWRGGGESDRVVREQTEQCAGRRSTQPVANQVWLLSMLLVLLSLVSVAFISIVIWPSVPSCSGKSPAPTSLHPVPRTYVTARHNPQWMPVSLGEHSRVYSLDGYSGGHQLQSLWSCSGV